MKPDKSFFIITALAVLSVMSYLKESFQTLADFKEYLLMVILCVSVFTLILIYSKFKNHAGKKKSSLASVDYMKLDPFQFEQFCANVLNANGYSVFPTKKAGDGGKDLVGINDKSERVFGEVKQYKASNKISRPLLQKLRGAMADNGVQNGIFITTSDFTKDALEYAKRNKIKCINRSELERLIRRS